MDKKNNTSSGGLGLGGVLTVVFVVLKLVGIINWNWWWVLSPIWISLAATLVIALFCVIACAIFRRRNRRK